MQREDARLWALKAERQIDLGGPLTATHIDHLKTFGDLVDLHINDMIELAERTDCPRDIGLRELPGWHAA